MNRLVQQYRYSFLKRVIDVYVKASFGASGAAAVDLNNKGIISFAKTGTGIYKCIFGTKPNGVNALDSYRRFLGVTCSVTTANATAAVAGVCVTDDQSADPTKGYIEVTFMAWDGTAVEPASGEVVDLTFTFNDSSAS